MTEEYKQRLITLAKELQEYRDTTPESDLPFLEKVDYLLGYISALSLSVTKKEEI